MHFSTQSILRAIRRADHHRYRRLIDTSRSHFAHARPISHSGVRARGTSRLTPTTLVVGIIPVLTFALGTWQVKRLRWKLDLIEQVDDQAHRPPLELPDYDHMVIPSEAAYRKFLLKGKWDHSRSILVGPKTYDGVHGYHVVTPLVREGGSTILVDRGFVSKRLVSPGNLQKLYAPNEEVTVLGMFRPQPRRNLFTPNNNPEKGEWYWTDVVAIKDWAGGDEKGVQNFLIEELFKGHSGEASDRISEGVPVGRSGRVELRNMHAVYAMTWYSLSFATGVMFLRLLRRPHSFAYRLSSR